jgi:hydrogenase maturation protease
MKPVRIICIGNRYCEADGAGPRVYDCLREKPLPAGVEVIDGGLAGLNLLALVEASACVVFVDQVEGYGRDGDIMVLDAVAFRDSASDRYGHGGGVAYLLRILSTMEETDLPATTVVGIEGRADAAGIERAAQLALAAAADRRPGTTLERAHVGF